MNSLLLTFDIEEFVIPLEQKLKVAKEKLTSVSRY